MLPWALAGAAIVAMAAGAVIEELGPRENLDASVLEDVLLLVGFAAFPVLGAVIASRLPRNSLGWIFLGLGLLVATGVLSTQYASYAFVDNPGALPFPSIAAWINTWWWYPALAVVPTLTFLLFPDGKPPTKRWNWVLWLAIIGIVLPTLLTMLQERLEVSIDDRGRVLFIDNPIGVPGLGDVEDRFGWLFIIVGAAAFLSALSLIFRFRRSRGDERQQLKILTFAGAVAVVSLLLTDVLHLPDIVFPIVVLSLPVSIAIAMLKYRLYDIDVVINRTLVYGLLTGLLAATYLSIVGTASTFAPDSNLAVAAATLAVAGLFQPLRRRIQGFIDRRFYRRKYDAAQTVDDFAARLRDEVDLEALEGDLLRVVADTMQPTSVVLWLRRDARIGRVT